MHCHNDAANERSGEMGNKLLTLSLSLRFSLSSQLNDLT